MLAQLPHGDEGSPATARSEPVTREDAQELRDVERRDIVDIDAPAPVEERDQLAEVTAVRLERVPGQPALDLQMIEELIARLVEGEPAGHGSASTIAAFWQVFRGCARLVETP